MVKFEPLWMLERHCEFGVRNLRIRGPIRNQALPWGINSPASALAIAIESGHHRCCRCRSSPPSSPREGVRPGELDAAAIDTEDSQLSGLIEDKDNVGF
jgi:hypothetical protein